MYLFGPSTFPLTFLQLTSIAAPIAYPIAKLLDFVLGAHGAHTYSKRELQSLLALHADDDGPHATACGGPLCAGELRMLHGVLALGGTRADALMTPLRDVLALGADAVLDAPRVAALLASGHPCFPVHEPGRRDAFVGLLHLTMVGGACAR
jgi:metal transporter CNNM